MKNLLTILFICVFYSFSYSQTAGNYVYEKLKNANTGNYQPPKKNTRSLNSRTLTIEASALMNVVPNSQIIVFTIVQLGESAQEATELIDSKINPIKAKLKLLGIRDSDVVVDMISFIPRYEDTVIKKRFSKTFTEIPKGFELKKNIHIKVKDHEKIDKIIAICATHEVYDMANAEYVVLNNEENMKAMRDKMLKHLANKIAFYHNLDVQDEIEIIQINEQSDEHYPTDRYQRYTAHSSSSYEALGKSKRKKSVKRVSKNTSLFYDPLSTKNFDIVMNPGIIEPTVQYTYNINIIYTLPVKKKEAPKVEEKIVEKIIEKKEFILISPTGETKVLEL